MGRTPTPEDLVGLAEGDLHALRLAIDLCLASDPPDDPDGPDPEQIADLLDDPEDLFGRCRGTCLPSTTDFAVEIVCLAKSALRD